MKIPILTTEFLELNVVGKRGRPGQKVEQKVEQNQEDVEPTESGRTTRRNQVRCD